MKNVVDLGVIDDTCLIFGGCYSNLQATEALLAVAHNNHIPANRMICTGDMVAYCGDPQTTVDLIKDNLINVIKGNCEQSLALNSDQCGCGYDQGSSCDLLSVKWYQYSANQLTNETKNWMAGLPDALIFQMAGLKLQVVHGAVSSINRFIFPATATSIKSEELSLCGADGIICGHSGIPFTQFIDNRLWHNAGVIGMPANDGTPRVWYSILTPHNDRIEIKNCCLTYDNKQAVNSMEVNQLPLEYAQTLETGLWASDEIMPDQDRCLRGEEIKPQTFVWKN